jgi:hypothetical protein
VDRQLTCQPVSSSVRPGHRRLGYCTAASAVIVLGALALVEWPFAWRRSGGAPEIELTLSPDEPQPVAEPVVDPPEQAAEEPPLLEEEEIVPDASPSVAAEEPNEAPAALTGQPQIDWQGSLERASARTVEEHAEVDSLHPEFDELRRIAATRYAEPRTGKPPPIWENVEKDVTGRTILRSGNCFRVLDDPNVGNRYAFETFEKHLVFCGWTAAPRQEFPWIKTIVARYPYLREPDGGAAGPAGEVAVEAESEP